MKPEEAIDHIGGKVTAVDDCYGTYIGELVEIGGEPQRRARVRICACTGYPKQHAVIFRSVLRERFPFKKGETVSFGLDKLEAYEGEVPGYEASVRAALEKAISETRTSGNMTILLRLLRHRAGAA